MDLNQPKNSVVGIKKMNSEIEVEEMMYFCKNRKCHNEVNQRGDLCVKCSPPEVETCGKCGTSDDVWALGFCSKCWIDKNTQMSDGYFCGFAECKDCKVYPYSCRTCQCDECGELYSLKEGDEATEMCYKCKENPPKKCPCGEVSISDMVGQCIHCYYADRDVRYNINNDCEHCS